MVLSQPAEACWRAAFFLQLAEQTAAGVHAGQEDLLAWAVRARPRRKVRSAHSRRLARQRRSRARKEVLGLYLSGHPIAAYRSLIEQICSDHQTADRRGGSACGFRCGGGGDDAPARRRPFRQNRDAGGLARRSAHIGGDRPGKIVVLDDRSARSSAGSIFDPGRNSRACCGATRCVRTVDIRAVQRDGRDLEHRLYAKNFFDLDGVIRECAERLV